MTFDFDQVIDRRDTGSAKWQKYAADVLPMWVADLDFAVAPPIVAALRARLAQPVFGYAVARDALRQCIVADLAAQYSWAIAPDDIVFLPGVEPGFNMALHAFFTPGDGVAVHAPVYRPLHQAPGHWGLRRLDLALDDGAIDLAQFAATMAEAQGLLLCNPHNPQGKVFGREELRAMADVCLAEDALIISDEIHCELLYDGRRHIPIASLDAAVAARTITLMAASKTYNIAGLKTAFAIIQNPDLRERFSAARLGMVDSVNLFGMEATLAAYAEGAAWKRELLVYLQGNRDYLVEAVRTRLPGVTMHVPQATFLAWLDCSALQIALPQEFFLQNAKVGLNGGAEFGAPFGQFVRLNFGCPRALLEEGLSRIEAALRQRNR